MKLNFLSVIIFGSIILCSQARATTIECDNTMVAKCMCAASMVMKCGNITGNIKDDAPLDFLKLVVTSSQGQQRTVTITKPPGRIRDYYALEYNDWIKKNLPGGYKAGDKLQVAVNGFGLDSTTPLYNDHNANNQIGAAGGGSGPSQKCWYVEQPSVVDFPSGCTKNACVAKGECYDSSGRIFRTNIFCKAIKGSSCPSADECAADEDVQVADPQNAKNIKVEEKKSSVIK